MPCRDLLIPIWSSLASPSFFHSISVDPVGFIFFASTTGWPISWQIQFNSVVPRTRLSLLTLGHRIWQRWIGRKRKKKKLCWNMWGSQQIKPICHKSRIMMPTIVVVSRYRHKPNVVKIRFEIITTPSIWSNNVNTSSCLCRLYRYIYNRVCLLCRNCGGAP